MTKKLAKTRVAVLRFLIEQFIDRAPEFPGDEKLASEIGTAVADVEDAVRDL